MVYIGLKQHRREISTLIILWIMLWNEEYLLKINPWELLVRFDPSLDCLNQHLFMWNFLKVLHQFHLPKVGKISISNWIQVSSITLNQIMFLQCIINDLWCILQPEMVIRNGYPVETHNVTTEDGYILSIHHIPYSPKHNNSQKHRPVAFLQHGILCSSIDWIILGPGKALGKPIIKLRWWAVFNVLYNGP